MKIRKYKEKDKEQVKKMITAVLIEMFGDTIIKGWEDFSGYKVFFVIEDNGKIVGSAALRDLGNGVGKIKRMYIYKEYRGKGLGRKLLEKLINFARKNNFKRLVLSTHPKLESAFNLYKKNGFVIIKNPNIKRDFPDLLKEDVKGTICMEKKL